MSCRGAGWGGCGPLHLNANVRRLELDEHLAAALPQSAATAWQKFQPGGEVDADVMLVYDGQAWKPQVTLKCLDVSFSYVEFPYRVTQCSGTVVLKDGLLTANVAGRAGSQPVHMAARLSDPFGTPCGWVEATGDDLPFDQKLYACDARDDPDSWSARSILKVRPTTEPAGGATIPARRHTAGWWSRSIASVCATTSSLMHLRTSAARSRCTMTIGRVATWKDGTTTPWSLARADGHPARPAANCRCTSPAPTSAWTTSFATPWPVHGCGGCGPTCGWKARWTSTSRSGGATPKSDR